MALIVGKIAPLASGVGKLPISVWSATPKDLPKEMELSIGIHIPPYG